MANGERILGCGIVDLQFYFKNCGEQIMRSLGELDISKGGSTVFPEMFICRLSLV
jgi:hypothetical protein